MTEVPAALVNLTITRADPSQDLKEVYVAVRSRFTRIPKVHDLILAGVPTEVIPTYAALADYSNNKSGLCWPRMDTLARRLSRSPRTIQRHPAPKKNTGRRKRGGERKQEGAERRATTGSSSRGTLPTAASFEGGE